LPTWAVGEETEEARKGSGKDHLRREQFKWSENQGKDLEYRMKELSVVLKEKRTPCKQSAAGKMRVTLAKEQ
jgi:hypothetical protein